MMNMVESTPSKPKNGPNPGLLLQNDHDRTTTSPALKQNDPSKKALRHFPDQPSWTPT